MGPAVRRAAPRTMAWGDHFPYISLNILLGSTAASVISTSKLINNRNKSKRNKKAKHLGDNACG